MTSHITIIPASSRAGRETIRSLLGSEKPPLIRGFYRDPSKAPAEFTQNPNFEAVKGDVGADKELDFSRSNAVLYVPPPTFDGSDQGEFATRAAHNVANALKKANVKRLVLHSAMGANHSQGIGVLRLNHISDELLKEAAAEVIIVKPAWYFEMWAPALQTMQAEEASFESPFSPAEFSWPQVSVRDVGDYCAKFLLEEQPVSSPHYVDILGPRDYSSLDIKGVIEQVTGKKGTLVTVPKEELAEFFGKEVPKDYVPDFVDMITSILPGGVLDKDPGFGEHIVRGKLEPIDALRIVASQ